jgi:hypothetical protein
LREVWHVFASAANLAESLKAEVKEPWWKRVVLLELLKMMGEKK